ncbi:hypothetical protein WICPIJ_010102, partial [Wickerhamomyces pijperi]
VSPEPITFPSETTSLLQQPQSTNGQHGRPPHETFQSFPPLPQDADAQTSVNSENNLRDVESQSLFRGRHGFLRLWISLIPTLYDLYKGYFLPFVIRLDIFALVLLFLNDCYEFLSLDDLSVDVTLEQICVFIGLLWCWIMSNEVWFHEDEEVEYDEGEDEAIEEQEGDTASHGNKKKDHSYSYKLHYDTVILFLFALLTFFQYLGLNTVLTRDGLDSIINFSQRFTLTSKLVKSVKWLNLIVIITYDLIQNVYENHHLHHDINQPQQRLLRVNKQRIYHVLYHLIKFVVIIALSIVCLGELINLLTLRRSTVTQFDSPPSNLSRARMHCIDTECSSLLQIQCHGLDDTTGLPSTQPLVLYFSGYYDSATHSSTWLEDAYNSRDIRPLQRYCIIERPGYNDLTSAYTDLKSPVSFEDVVKGVKYAMETDYGIDFHPDSSSEPPLQVCLVGYGQGAQFVQLFASIIDPVVLHSAMFIDGWNDKVYQYGFNWEFNRQFANIIPRFTRWENIKRYFYSVLLKFDIFTHVKKLWVNIILNNNENTHTTVRSNSFNRAKFKEFLTYNLLSKPQLVQSQKALLNVKLSILSADNLIKASTRWSELQRELVMMSKLVYEWDIVKLSAAALQMDETNVESQLTEVWNDELAKKELGKALLRLVES